MIRTSGLDEAPTTPTPQMSSQRKADQAKCVWRVTAGQAGGVGCAMSNTCGGSYGLRRELEVSNAALRQR